MGHVEELGRDVYLVGTSLERHRLDWVDAPRVLDVHRHHVGHIVHLGRCVRVVPLVADRDIIDHVPDPAAVDHETLDRVFPDDGHRIGDRQVDDHQVTTDLVT